MKVLSILCISIWLSACNSLGNINSIYRPFNTSLGNGALIDIKQRAILVGKGKENQTIVCAEPSPDALSSYLSDVSANLEVDDKGKAGFTRKLAENAAFVGLRTQSIQLLRDSYYRLCEAHMNGAISASDYDIQMRRYQQYMIALLSIESLTGAVKTSQVNLTPSYLNALSLELPKLLAEQKEIKAKIATEEKKEKKDDGKIKSLNGELATSKSNYSKIVNTLTKEKENKKAKSSQPTSGEENVASAVRSMVEKVLDTDYYGQLCWTIFTKKEYLDNPPPHELREACAKFFKLKNSELSQNMALAKKRNVYQIKSLQEKDKLNIRQLNLIAKLNDKVSKGDNTIKKEEIAKLMENFNKMLEKQRSEIIAQLKGSNTTPVKAMNVESNPGFRVYENKSIDK